MKIRSGMAKFFFLLLFFSLNKNETSTQITDSKPVFGISEERIVMDSTQLTRLKNEFLLSLQQSDSSQTSWKPSQRKTVLSILRQSYEDGLNPEEYRVKRLEKYEEQSDSLSNKDNTEYDLQLTNNLQKYISHLTNGRLNPRKLYGDWDLQRTKIDLPEIIAQLQNTDSIAEKIEQLRPHHVVYKSLKKALRIINEFPDESFKNILVSKSVLPKDSIPVIIEIKKRLIYWKDLEHRDTLTMVYDSLTVEAIKKFQTRHGLLTDGIIGKETVTSLNYSKKQRQEQIIANLERWKWFPKEMGSEYLIINIPDYKLRLIKNSDTLRTHKVIVGTNKRKTPILSSKLDYAVFNPTWTVPPTILKEDVIPATLKNRNYLAERNITVYNSKGNVISANNWQWSQSKNYRYVQSPGTFNSLGMVKLNFPNRFAVYLHDTNHRDYFEKKERSLSSGCVRVDNPLELTEYLLDDPANWNLEKITETLQNQKTKQVKINKDVNIHLLYWTAWSEGNTLIFRDDIYALDADLYAKLRN